MRPRPVRQGAPHDLFPRKVLVGTLLGVACGITGIGMGITLLIIAALVILVCCAIQFFGNLLFNSAPAAPPARPSILESRSFLQEETKSLNHVHTPSFSERLAKIKQTIVPKKYEDPIHLGIMNNPLALVPCGHVLDACSYSNLVKSNLKCDCPTCREPIRDVIPNAAVKSMIDGWVTKQEQAARALQPISAHPAAECKSPRMEQRSNSLPSPSPSGQLPILFFNPRRVKLPGADAEARHVRRRLQRSESF